MAKFFNYFPTTLYTPSRKSQGLDVVTNIITRFSFERTLKENSVAFYPYTIKDSDTPEIIAKKFYENPERHWIVLLFNDIIDPQYDWPLEGRTLNEFIDKKYSSRGSANTTSQTGLAWAQSINNVYAYYKVITETTFEKTTITKYEVDKILYANNIAMGIGTNTYTLNDGTRVTIQISKEIKTYYDYEVEENEKKREINLLKPEFISQIEKEFKKVVKE
jgi:hypothetical protein